MNTFLLLTDAAGTAADAAGGRLLLDYIIYFVIIAVGIVVLLFLRRATRLPSHADVKERVAAFSDALKETEKSAPERLVERINRAGKLISDCDKLIYQTSALAQKERDGDMDKVCTLLEEARGELSAFRLNGGNESWRLSEAHMRTENAVGVLTNILERDKTLKKNKKRA